MSVPFSIPSRPPSGTTPWNLEAQFNATQTQVRNDESSIGHTLDSFDGADDDAKLTAALSYAAAQTYPPVIRFGNRQYNFATGGREPYRGMRLVGPRGYSTAELTKTPCEIKLASFGTGWFHAPASSTKYAGVHFEGLTFKGGSTASVLTQDATAAGFIEMHMRDIGAASVRSVLGTTAQKVLLQLCNFDGHWNVNGVYGHAFHVGGSDNLFFPQGGAFDSNDAFNDAGGSNGAYLLKFSFLSKSYLGPIFMTAESKWNGILVDGPADHNSGSATDGMLTVTGARIEGRGPTGACNGNLIRVEGGQLLMDRCWLAYGMGSPATPGHTVQDAGIVHQRGGVLDMNSCVYDRASGQAETVPLVYASGGICIVKKTHKASRGGTWTGLPRVDEQVGVTVDADAYVTVI